MNPSNQNIIFSFLNNLGAQFSTMWSCLDNFSEVLIFQLLVPLSFRFLAIPVICKHLKVVNVEGLSDLSFYKATQLRQNAQKLSDFIFKNVEQTCSDVLSKCVSTQLLQHNHITQKFQVNCLIFVFACALACICLLTFIAPFWIECMDPAGSFKL